MRSKIRARETDCPGEVEFYHRNRMWDEKLKVYKGLSYRNHVSSFYPRVEEEMFEGDNFLLGAWKKLEGRIDSNGMIGVYDTHLRQYKPVHSMMDIYWTLGIGGRKAQSRFRKIVKDNNLLCSLKTETGEKLYFINPVYKMHERGFTLIVYKLFKANIDRELTSKAIKFLEELCSDPFANNSARVTEVCSDRMLVDGKPVDEVLGDMERGYTEDEANECAIESFELAQARKVLDEYMLDNVPIETWILDRQKGMIRGTRETNVWFTPNRIADGKPRKKENVVAYRNLYLDLDAGRDTNGNYYALNDVNARKRGMLEMLKHVPSPTMVVNTRNGYHVYWSVAKKDHGNGVRWQEVQNRLAAMLHPIADPQCTDSVRLLRVPGSIHLKEGLERTVCGIVFSSPHRIGLDDMDRELDERKETISSAVDEYLKMFPTCGEDRRSKSFSAPLAATKEVPERIKDIQSLSTATFPAKKGKTVAVQRKCAMESMRKSVDMADFLGVTSPKSFRCVFPDHEDKHPSATIYKNKDHDRYICSCDKEGKGLDIFDVVMRISGCNLNEAIEYVAAASNTEIVD